MQTKKYFLSNHFFVDLKLQNHVICSDGFPVKKTLNPLVVGNTRWNQNNRLQTKIVNVLNKDLNSKFEIKTELDLEMEFVHQKCWCSLTYGSKFYLIFGVDQFSFIPAVGTKS